MRAYQTDSLNHTLLNPQCALFMGCGLGKTVVTLTSIKERIDHMQVGSALVLGPLRVVQSVWAQEIEAWTHLQELTCSLLHGAKATRESALLRPAHIYLMNYEGLPWLAEAVERLYLSQGKPPPFDMLVADELTKLKDSTTKRHKALRVLLPYMPCRIGLSGTPVSNGYGDLFGQMLAVDSGQRLGTSKWKFDREHFTPKKHKFQKAELKEGSVSRIAGAVADICLQMKTRDYLDLPPVTYNDVPCTLAPSEQKAYDRLEAEVVLAWRGSEEVTEFTAQAKTIKLLQFANGAVYRVAGRQDSWSQVSEAKLNALDSVVAETSTPLVIYHQFRSDADRIMARYPQAEQLVGGLSADALNDLLARWNAGKIPTLVAHPASASHGLNLQHGGHTCAWFGLPWSLDQYIQANARVDRSGQTRPVFVHRLIVSNTMDEVVAERLEGKAGDQETMQAAIQRYIDTKY